MISYILRVKCYRNRSVHKLVFSMRSFLLIATLALSVSACSSAGIRPASPTLQAVNGYQECVITSAGKLPKTQADRIPVAEASCQKQLDAYRQRYVILGTPTNVTEKAVAGLVEDTRATLKRLNV